MVAVFSTENLLLNAYRQRFWGFPVFFSADASYRYTKEGMALYPIMTTNIAQQSKIIAYGLVTNENEMAQRIIFRAVKAEVERIVKERKLHKIPIYM
jgi:hypothetical protein